MNDGGYYYDDEPDDTEAQGPPHSAAPTRGTRFELLLLGGLGAASGGLLVMTDSLMSRGSGWVLGVAALALVWARLKSTMAWQRVRGIVGFGGQSAILLVGACVALGLVIGHSWGIAAWLS